MKQKKVRRIFNDVELYNFCLCKVSGISLEEETGYSSDWADFVGQDLENKYNRLSIAGQNEFDKQLRKVAIKFKEDFGNLSQEIESEEDYMNLQGKKERLVYEIASELREFLAE